MAQARTFDFRFVRVRPYGTHAHRCALLASPCAPISCAAMLAASPLARSWQPSDVELCAWHRSGMAISRTQMSTHRSPAARLTPKAQCRRHSLASTFRRSGQASRTRSAFRSSLTGFAPRPVGRLARLRPPADLHRLPFQQKTRLIPPAAPHKTFCCRLNAARIVAAPGKIPKFSEI